MNMVIVYTIESNSLWYRGKYEFSFTITDKFPYIPPKVKCNTKIFHPNIDYNGYISLNILRADWKPIIEFSVIFAGLYLLFLEPNPNDTLNHEAGALMRQDVDKFEAVVKQTMEG